MPGRKVLEVLLVVGAIRGPVMGASFIRGDVDSNGVPQVTDAIRIFGFLFLGNPKSLSCEDAADTNDSGDLDLSDGILLLNYLFSGGVAPAPPFPECGTDFSRDNLHCREFELCGPSICGGILGTPCEEGEFCDLQPGSCNGADFQGECVAIPGACPDVFKPVCGCDGKTYSNDCERLAAQVQKDHDGECATKCGGIAGLPCSEGEFCELPTGSCQGADLEGECVPAPGICPAIFDPVCGCDGKTYGNDCERRAAHVQKDHDGECLQ